MTRPVDRLPPAAAAPAAPAAPARTPRDPRLDFFRGLAMFIILLAHTPGNSWTLWIPARFGFSDAAEIFVFCSGMASAIAFGGVFARRGWAMGAARVAYRVWQVYWAHVGVFLVTATMLFAIDRSGLAFRDHAYVTEPYVVPLFERTGETLVGLLTLTYVPGLFDILPMYLVILGMIPVVVLCHRLGGLAGVAVAVFVTWAAAQLAGYAETAGATPDPGTIQRAALAAGERLDFLNLPADPFGDGSWFFNPFGWQVVFFTGFALGMKWLSPPPVRRALVLAAAGYLLLVVPFAWFKIHEGFYLPAEWALTGWIADTRAWLEPLWWKPWIGALRYLHFLALAYLAWAAVGPKGVRLSAGFAAPGAPPRWLVAAAAGLALATVPYAYVAEIAWAAPWLDRWIVRHLPLVSGDRIGLLQLAHLGALVVLGWAALDPRGRRWLTHDAVIRTVPVIRKVGTQSLAVFLVSVVLSQIDGWLLDWLQQPGVWGARDVWVTALVNLWGFAVLVGTAYLVSWFKRHPWRAETVRSGTPAAPEGAAPPAGQVVALRR